MSTIENFLATAATFPEEELIDKAINSLNEYKLLKTKSSQLDASLFCQLFISKMTIKEKGLSTTIREVCELSNISAGIKNKGSN